MPKYVGAAIKASFISSYSSLFVDRNPSFLFLPPSTLVLGHISLDRSVERVFDACIRLI